MKDSFVTYRQFLNTLFFLVFISSSFDVFLNLKIGGFSFRFVYIVILILLSIYLGDTIWKGILRVQAVGMLSFIIWSGFLIVFIPNTPLLSRNIGYIVWLYIHFVFITIASYYIHAVNVNQIVKLYLLSFLIVSLFGLLQFFVALFGVSMLVEQWWIDGRLARINAFSYEPSYFATYLLIGFSFAYYLQRNKIATFGKLPLYTVIISGSALVLSTSRMGIMLTAIQVLCFEVLVKRKSFNQLLFFLIGFVVVLGGIFLYIASNENLGFLLAGLGILGGSDHSSAERLDGFLTQLAIFSRSPFKGYSLGGVSQAIAFEKGVTSISQETIKIYDVSINIFLEVLTASGIIGFLFFMLYIYYTIAKPLRFARREELLTSDAVLLKALIWSLLFELLILCFNQNILRAYLWIHIALINAVYFALKNLSKHVLRPKQHDLV